MNTDISNKIINQTTQFLAGNRSVSLVFHYPANFKIGDTIEVTAPKETLQLLVPQHDEDYFAFDVEIWDDRVRLFCDSMKETGVSGAEGAVFSFRIRDISLFANRFRNAKNQEMYN